MSSIQEILVNNNKPLRHSDSIPRHCSRCGKELTDAASRERHMGPDCAAKNTTIFAKQIPAQLAKASVLLLSLHQDNFHEEIASEFNDIRDLYLTKIKTLTNNNTTNNNVVLSGSDFRKIVDWFDCTLSYPISYNTRNTVINFIEALGYQALAGILRGDVCMSPAKVFVDANNMLTLEGKYNKYGHFLLRKNIPGLQYPKYRGHKVPYKCSLCYHKIFFEIVNKHWPFNEGVEEIQTKIDNQQYNLNEPQGPSGAFNSQDASGTWSVDQKPSVRLTEAFNVVYVKLPWNEVYNKKEIYEIIDKFKTIPYKDRKYDGNNNTWSFKPSYKNFIVDAVKDKYEITYTTG